METITTVQCKNFKISNPVQKLMNGKILISIVVLFMLGPFIINDVYAQTTLNVTEFTPCFLNYTSTGLEMLQNCGFDDDYLSFATIAFDWVTGGLFPMILVSILIIMTYVKYQTGIYPIAIGIMFLPYAAWAFPNEFISYAIAIAAVVGGGAVLNAVIKRTTDY